MASSMLTSFVVLRKHSAQNSFKFLYLHSYFSRLKTWKIFQFQYVENDIFKEMKFEKFYSGCNKK